MVSCCPNIITAICCNAVTTWDNNLSLSASTLLHNLDFYAEPYSYEEVAAKLEWQEAMQKEFNSLQANHTWDLIELLSGKRHISCKWVYKIKYKAYGSLERYEARLIMRGFTQKEGMDYTETFSSIIKMTAIRSSIAIAVKKHWSLYQMSIMPFYKVI